MRALVLSLLLLSGCFGYEHGCWEDSRSGTWTEPGIYERLLGDPAWEHSLAEANMPEGSRFDGEWVWLFRHLDSEQTLRLGERDGQASVGGLLRSKTTDDQAATAIEAFVLDHTGTDVDGHAFLEQRRSGDPNRLVRGSIDATVDIEGFLAKDGSWHWRNVGNWEYVVDDDRLLVRVSTIRYDGDWAAGVHVDAGDRVKGPSVDAGSDDEAMQAAAAAWWQDKGLGEPTFQDFGYESQDVCT